MAEKRMFTKKITESDAFLDMPLSTQALYFHLNMSADDDGFVNNPRKIQRMIGAADDDMKVLLAKNFIIAFESGVIVIKHWRMHNYIQSDRYKPTDYSEEMSMLSVKENKAYSLSASKMDTECIQIGYTDKNSIGKDRLGKVSIGENSIGDKSPAQSKHKKETYGEYGNVKLADDERDKLFSSYGEEKAMNAINYLDRYIEEKGAKYKSHYLTILRWVINAVDEQSRRNRNNQDVHGIDWSNV